MKSERIRSGDSFLLNECSDSGAERRHLAGEAECSLKRMSLGSEGNEDNGVAREKVLRKGGEGAAMQK